MDETSESVLEPAILITSAEIVHQGAALERKLISDIAVEGDA